MKYIVGKGHDIQMTGIPNDSDVRYFDVDGCEAKCFDNYWEAYGYAAKMSKKLGVPLVRTVLEI